MIRVLVCLALLTSFTSPAYPQQQLHIRLNQIGFPFGGVKTAVVFGGESLPTDFRVVNAHSGAPIFKGKVDPLTGGWGQFERLGQMDFTSLTVEGHYDLEVGSTRSRPFVIAAGVYHDVANHLLEFMRQQRCGYNRSSTPSAIASTGALRLASASRSSGVRTT